MHRANGTICIIIASFVYAIASFYRLLACRFYWKFFQYLAIFLIWGALLAAGYCWSADIEDRNQRVWAVIPIVVQIPVFLLSGFILRKRVECILNPSPNAVTKIPSPRIRVFGAALTMIAVLLWLYGVLHPMTGPGSAIILGIMCYSGIFGIPYLLTGKRINELK